VKASRGLPPDAAETIETTGVVHLRFGGGAPGPIQFVDAFPLTEDRKADLFPQKWRALGADAFRFVENPGTAEAPLALLSPATSRTINSTLGDLDDRPLTASLAPGDAAARGLRDGDVARIFNRLSSLTALVRVDPTLREGVCVLPKGAWLRTTRDGRGPNSLISQETTPVTGGATYNDARVEVAKV
jgi:anaerobic selenocysteine-containing dehydrogenase